MRDKQTTPKPDTTKSAPDRSSIWHRGESVAASYLERSGFVICERNWSCSVGEIDLVCRDGDAIVIVEVKARLAAADAERYLFETVTPRKQRKLRVLAEIYAQRARSRGMQFRALRIDVVGVILRPGAGVVTVKHLRAAV